MSHTDLRESNNGVVFAMTILDQDGEVVDLSTATNLEIIFKDPLGTVTHEVATLVTDGVDGQMQVVTTPDFLTEGAWRYQGLIEFSTGRWRTEIFQFTVLADLD